MELSRMSIPVRIDEQEVQDVRIYVQDVNPGAAPGPGFNGGAAGDSPDQAVSMETVQSVSPDPYARTTPDQHSSGRESSLSATSPADAASIGQRTKALKSLKESIPHAMHLEQLQKGERQFQKDGSWHKKSVRRLSKDLYVVVSWYAILQSALFAAVAQTSIFTCEDWWGPVFMAVLVTVGTFASVLDKLRCMGEEQEKVRLFQARQNAVYDSIAQLIDRGSACNLDSLQPRHNLVQTLNPGCLCICSPHGFLVLGFLVGFSTLVIVSCLRMLCGPSCKC